MSFPERQPSIVPPRFTRHPDIAGPEIGGPLDAPARSASVDKELRRGQAALVRQKAELDALRAKVDSLRAAQAKVRAPSEAEAQDLASAMRSVREERLARSAALERQREARRGMLLARNQLERDAALLEAQGVERERAEREMRQLEAKRDALLRNAQAVAVATDEASTVEASAVEADIVEVDTELLTPGVQADRDAELVRTMRSGGVTTPASPPGALRAVDGPPTRGPAAFRTHSTVFRRDSFVPPGIVKPDASVRSSVQNTVSRPMAHAARNGRTRAPRSTKSRFGEASFFSDRPFHSPVKTEVVEDSDGTDNALRGRRPNRKQAGPRRHDPEALLDVLMGGGGRSSHAPSAKDASAAAAALGFDPEGRGSGGGDAEERAIDAMAESSRKVYFEAKEAGRSTRGMAADRQFNSILQQHPSKLLGRHLRLGQKGATEGATSASAAPLPARTRSPSPLSQPSMERLAQLAALPPPKDVIEKVFREFDVDGSGSLAVSELMRVFRHLGLGGISAGRIRVALKRQDLDSDGSFDCEELRAIVKMLGVQRSVDEYVKSQAKYHGHEKMAVVFRDRDAFGRRLEGGERDESAAVDVQDFGRHDDEVQLDLMAKIMHVERRRSKIDTPRRGDWDLPETSPGDAIERAHEAYRTSHARRAHARRRARPDPFHQLVRESLLKRAHSSSPETRERETLRLRESAARAKRRAEDKKMHLAWCWGLKPGDLVEAYSDQAWWSTAMIEAVRKKVVGQTEAAIARLETTAWTGEEYGADGVLKPCDNCAYHFMCDVRYVQVPFLDKGRVRVSRRVKEDLSASEVRRMIRSVEQKVRRKIADALGFISYTLASDVAPKDKDSANITQIRRSSPAYGDAVEDTMKRAAVAAGALWSDKQRGPAPVRKRKSRWRS
jgi:hypothetical protein